MEKVIFTNDKDDQYFIVKDLRDFKLPNIGESVAWFGMFFRVQNVIHDYDKKQIQVVLKRM